MGTLLARMPFFGALLLILATGKATLGDPPQSSPAPQQKANAEEIKKLIEQLGSPKFFEREEASQRLEKIGQPAVDSLRKATESKDAEVRRRAKELVRIISPEVSEAPWEKLLKEGIHEERSNKDYKKAVEVLAKAAEMSKQQLHPNQRIGPPSDIPILTDIYLHLARSHHALKEWQKAGNDYHAAEYYSSFNNEVRKQIQREWSEMTDNLLSYWQKVVETKIVKSAELKRIVATYPLIVLHSRRFAGGGYLKSAYSFKYETAEPGKHRNDVHLLI